VNLPADRSRALGVTLGLSIALGWIAWRFWVHREDLVDDAFIGFRYAANLLAGQGLVFNPGEVVEGVTNTGWILVLAGLGWMGPLPAVAKAVGASCLASAVVLAALAYRRLAPEASGLELGLLPLLVVSQPEAVYFSLAGMETGLAALLLVSLLWCLLGERHRPALAALLAAVLFTVRPETVVAFPSFVLLVWLAGWLPGRALPERESLQRFLPAGLWAFGLFVALVAAVTLGRLAYFGELLPNTFVAKGSGGAGEVLERGWRLVLGRNPNAPPPWGGPLLLLAGGYGTWTLRRRRPLAALLLAAAAGTGLAFAAYARPDWTGMGRYFAPYLPLAAILLVHGIFAGTARLPRLAPRTARGLAALIVLAFVGYGLWRTQGHLGRAALGEYPGFVLASEGLAPAARWVDRNLPEDTVVATRRIGALGYHGRRAVFDYAFGLTDPAVAHRAGVHGSDFDDPDEEDLTDLWRAAAPDCLLEDDDRVARLRVSLARPDELEVHGLRYRVVRSFPLGDGRTRWVLACRPGTGVAGL